MKKIIIILVALIGTSFSQTPNIVLIFIDDMGWSDVGYNEKNYFNPTYYQTPYIDKLATESLVFNEAYANAGNCAPSRAALISGQYSPRTGVYTVGSTSRGPTEQRRIVTPQNTSHLGANFVTMGETLKAAGYKTAHMGKWHMGEAGTSEGPVAQGYELNIAGSTFGSPPGGFACPWDSRAPTLGNCTNGENLTDRITDEAIKFVNTNQSNKFFLYLSYYTVHLPFGELPASVVNKYNALTGSNGHTSASYAAAIEIMDRNVGRFLDELNTLNLNQNTIVVFTSDNGPISSNAFPLRQKKGSLYEGGIREPFIIRWPGKSTPGSTSDIPIQLTDLYPTFMNAVGGSVPNNYVLDGEDFLPIIDGSGSLNREAIYWHSPAYLTGSSEGISGSRPGFRLTPSGAIRMGDYKLIEYFEFGQLELYNIKDDMDESDNLALQMPGKVREMRDKLKAWQTTTNAPVPTQLNSGFDNNNAPARSSYVTWDDVKDLPVNVKRNISDLQKSFKISVVNQGLMLNSMLLENTRTEVRLLNVMGREVLSRIFSSSTTNGILIPKSELNGLSPGIKFLKITIDGSTFIKSFIWGKGLKSISFREMI